MTSTKSGAAWLSVVSNCVLIVLKLAAGLLTGSIAILTEAIHSAIDLVASLIALFSVRKAEEPADEDHPYGHEKAENVAAGAEAMLILLGAVIIVDRGRSPAAQRLPRSPTSGSASRSSPSRSSPTCSSRGICYRRARALESPALEGDAAHLRADALTSIGRPRRPRPRQDDRERRLRLDRRAAGRGSDRRDRRAARAGARAGCWMDEALPDEELDRIEQRDRRFPARPRWPATTGCAAAAPGSRRHVDLHVQFRAGTSLEEAHRQAHDLRDAIEAEFSDADVLIHVEPEESYRGAGEEASRFRHG